MPEHQHVGVIGPRLRSLLAASAVLVAACGAAGGSVSTTTQTSRSSTTATVATTTTTATPAGVAVVGHTVEGREIEAISLGDGPGRLYLIGGIHGDERPAVENVLAILEHLQDAPLEGWTIRIVLDANPDGTAAATRANAAGVDLNRNWPSKGFVASPTTGTVPLSEPEAAAVAADIAAFGPDLIVALHAAREGPFVEYDGEAEGAAAAFAAGASIPGREWQIVPEVDWPTAGSVGTYFGKEGRIPVVTVEANRWDTPAAVLPELIGGLEALLAAPAAVLPPWPTCDDHRLGASCTPVTRVAHDLLHAGTTGGAHGFVIKAVGGTVHAAVNADTGFYPASAIKLVHLVHSLEWIAGGGDPATPVAVYDDGCVGDGPGHDEPLGQLLAKMMLLSDNVAANAIQSHFGLEELAGTVGDAGMTGTRLVHGFGCGGPANDPANRTTSIDLVRLLEGAVDGSAVSPDQWPLAESLLVDVTAEAGFGPGDGVRVLAKEGWYGTTLTIAGIAFVQTDAGDRTLVFAAFTDGAAAVAPAFTIAGVAGALIAGVAGG